MGCQADHHTMDNEISNCEMKNICKDWRWRSGRISVLHGFRNEFSPTVCPFNETSGELKCETK